MNFPPEGALSDDVKCAISSSMDDECRFPSEVRIAGIDRFVCRCLSDTLDGLQDGITHFSGPSRVAVIFTIAPQTPTCICDPQNLLRGHELKFKELYLDKTDWRENISAGLNLERFGYMLPRKNLELAGLISCGGCSRSVFHQMWFTEHHPDMCSIGPTERWLEHSAWRFSHDIANESDLYTGISGGFLREYATHAVRDYIVDRMNVLLGWDSQLRVYPILDAILGISRTPEEKVWPWGQLMFVEPSTLEALDFQVRFPELENPLLDNFKHVRKLLLTVENSERVLVSDGSGIVGIAGGRRPDFYLCADFHGSHGFLSLNDELVCSFSDGSFHSTTRRAKLVQLEEALLESDLDPSEGNNLFRLAASLVHNAQHERFGCALIVDLNPAPQKLSGQKLARPLDLQQPYSLELAKALSKVDGALHIGRDLHLHSFACLMDGRSIAGEDRARGARYNSALRFTGERRNLLVVVVSADRPVSVIQDGVELSAQCQWKPLNGCLFVPLTLAEWIRSEDAGAWADK
jgi:hypothetical protein